MVRLILHDLTAGSRAGSISAFNLMTPDSMFVHGGAHLLGNMLYL
jgi:hypothetical protein